MSNLRLFPVMLVTLALGSCIGATAQTTVSLPPAEEKVLWAAPRDLIRRYVEEKTTGFRMAQAGKFEKLDQLVPSPDAARVASLVCAGEAGVTAQFDPSTLQVGPIRENRTQAETSLLVDGSPVDKWPGSARPTGQLAFAPGSASLAYVRESPTGQMELVLDAKPAGRMPRNANWYFSLSPDAKRYAYCSSEEGALYVVLNGKRYGPWEYISNSLADAPKFSPNGTRFAFAAKRAGKWYVVVDGRERGPYDDGPSLEGVVFSEDSKHVAFCVGEGAPIRQEVYMGFTIKQYPRFIVVDDKRYGPYQWAGFLRWNPAGTSLSWQAEETRGGERRLLCDGREIARGVTGEQAYSKDGRLAYERERDGGRFIIVGDREYGPFRSTSGPVFAEDGTRLAWIAYGDGEHTLFVDGEPRGRYRALQSGSLEPYGEHEFVALVIAGSGAVGQQFLVTSTGARSDSYDLIVYGPPPDLRPFVLEGKTARFIAVKGSNVLSVTQPLP